LPNSFQEIKISSLGLKNYYVEWLLDPKPKQEVSKIEITNYPTWVGKFTSCKRNNSLEALTKAKNRPATI
jgi:hypothetical protein